MAWKGIDGRGLTVQQFAHHVAGLKFSAWRPSGVIVHNTGNPALYPLKGHGSWHGSPTSPQKRVNESLPGYYKGLGWSAGPHLFIDDELIWLFTPLTTQGVHSPSFNGTRIGLEMVGDFEIEQFNSGPGAKVRNNTVAALGILHAKLGLSPETIKLHREDPRTTHACPGKHVQKADLIRRVQEYMGEGGDHDNTDAPASDTPVAKPERMGVTAVNDLSFRAQSSASSDKIGSLPKGVNLAIISEAMNGETRWLRVRTPAGYVGWVSAKYVIIS